MLKSNQVILIISLVIVFDFFIWWQVLFSGPSPNTELYFLDIGQGDSELVVLPGGVKVLIDGGPDNKILGQLSSVFRPTDRYIDLVLMSHPQTDHFNGLIDVLKRYKVGAFISSGKSGKAQSFGDLEKAIKENKTPAIVLAEGDKIKYGESRFDIISPSESLLQSAEPNDWALVAKLVSQGASTLFTADIDSKIEKGLIQKYDIDIDVLKVAHHGSKFSSSEEFLASATPKVAVIEVGATNSYGHPTPQALQRLLAAGAQIFRTDKDGTIKISIDGEGLAFWKTK